MRNDCTSLDFTIKIYFINIITDRIYIYNGEIGKHWYIPSKKKDNYEILSFYFP